MNKFMERINSAPEEWADAYKKVTKKDMPLPKHLNFLKNTSGPASPKQSNFLKNTSGPASPKQSNFLKNTSGTASPKAAKGPTFPTQVASIAKNFGKAVHSNDDIHDDPEIGNMYAAVCRELATKFNPNGEDWGAASGRYRKACEKVKKAVSSVQDKMGFLSALLKHINPNAPAGEFNWKGKVKPGELVGLPVPNDPLSTKAMGMMQNLDRQAKANALKVKIESYEAEITRLKKLSHQAVKSKAEVDKKNLGGISEKLLKYFSYIEKNCSEYLSSVQQTHKFLFRGQDDALQPIFVAYPRPDRKPRNSDPEAQKLMDGYLKALGFKALRSNSIFTSTDYRQATEYGDVFAIFPKNGFSFTWSTEHDDFIMNDASDIDVDYEYPEDVASDYYDWKKELESFLESNFYEFVEGKEKLFKVGFDDDKQIKLIEKQTKAMPQYKALLVAFKSYNKLHKYDDEPIKFHKQFLSMMAAFKAFYDAYPYKWLSKNEIKSLEKYMDKARKAVNAATYNSVLTNKAKAVVKEQGYTYENFPAALKSGHEVCILGEYIAVNWDRYGDDIQKYFLGPKPKKD
jgi:hypothetical protein